MALCGVRSKQELTSRAVASGLRRSLRPAAWLCVRWLFGCKFFIVIAESEWSVRWPFHDGLMAAQIMGNVRVCKADCVLVPKTSMAVEENTKLGRELAQLLAVLLLLYTWSQR